MRLLLTLLVLQFVSCQGQPTSELSRVLQIATVDRSGNSVSVVRHCTEYAATSVGKLRGVKCPPPPIRVFADIETIGLATQNMAPVQLMNDSLYIVPTFYTPEELIYDIDLWVAIMNYCGGDAIGAVTIAEAVTAQALAAKSEEQDRLYNELVVSSLPLLTTRPDKPPEGEDGSYLSRLIEVARHRGSNFKNKKILDEENDISFPSGSPNNLLPSISNSNRTDVNLENRLAGMTFAHEGYQMHNGYGGNKVVPSMDSLATLHVNAVAVVPYTFQRGSHAATPFHIPRRGGAENDASTRNAIRRAKDQGWFTLLKPQIWVGGNSWPGDIEPRNEEDWARWFEHYRYWILHYALLAEEEQTDALCLGTELVKTTLNHPEAWRAIISDVRQVYGGALTYAANWGEEFEQLSFWSDLDVIGLNSYYPLSEKTDPTQADLDAAAEAWLSMAAGISKRFDKPLWLTEVGFRSVANPWVNPHAAPAERPVDYVAQRRCFEALTRAAAKTPELTGMFVWKWPSYLGRRSRGDRDVGFTPGGKPAGATLSRFYESWGTRME